MSSITNMNAPSKNPWIPAGLVAGIAVALGLFLIWPQKSAPGPAAVASAAASKEAPPDVCTRCLEQRCSLAIRACYGSKDGTPITWPSHDAGGPPSPEKQAGCQEVHSCFRKTKCAALDPGTCYCGEGVDVIKCLAGEVPAQGPCKDVIERNADTKDPKEIGMRYSDERYALGLGEDLRLCGATFCRDACK